MQDPNAAMNPASPIDGDNPPTAPPRDPAGGGDAGEGGDTGPVSVSQRITRFLCATAHLDGSYADHVVDLLLDPGRQAQAPAWEFDAVALASHAQLSRRRRLARDARLRLILVGIGVALVMGTVSAAAGRLSGTWLLLVLVGAPLIGFALAWNVVYEHYEVVRDAALTAVYDPATPRQTAPELDPDVEDALDDLHRANVVIFEGPPFLSSGIMLDSWRIVIDREGPEAVPHTEATGKPRDEVATIVEPSYFTARELHEHLARRVPEALAGVRAYERLYVDGGTAVGFRFGPGRRRSLVDTSPEGVAAIVRPVCRLEDRQAMEQQLESANPGRTARTYLAFVKHGLDGDVVVTTLVRAEVTSAELLLEGHSHVLLPLQNGFKDVGWINRDDPHAWRSIASATTDATPGLLLGSVGRWISSKLAIMQWRRRLRDEGRMILAQQPVHFGARGSLREEAMVSGDLSHYAKNDEVMYFRVLTRSILAQLEVFLEERGLGGRQFAEQRQLVLDRSFAVDGVLNGHVVGSDNSAMRAGV